MRAASAHHGFLVAGAVCLFGMFGAANAHAAKVLILPAAAERITVEDMDALRRLDEVVRSVATSSAGLVVLPEAQTKKELAAVKEMGIACDVEDAACLSKIAVLVEVDRIVAPIVRFDAERTTLRIVLVDAAGSRAQASRTTSAIPTATDVRAVLNEALAAAPSPPTPPTATTSSSSPTNPATTAATSADTATTTTTTTTTSTAMSGETSSPSSSSSASSSLSPPSSPSPSSPSASSPSVSSPSASSPSPSPSSPSSTFITGATVATAGAVVAVGCGIGAFAVHEALGERESFDARVGKMIGGQALLYASIAGVAGLGVGVALMVLE